MTDADHGGVEQRVLVLAPTVKDASLSSSILDRAGVTCHCCADLSEVCHELVAGAGAVLLTEEAINAGQDGPLMDWLTNQPPWSDLPLLVLAQTGAVSAAVAQAMDQMRNVTVLERPTRVAALVSAVRAALRARQRQYQIRDYLAERERSEQALRESEERFRMIADNMAQLAWSGDQLGNITWYNQRWLEYTGLPFDAMKGWGWIKVQHPDHLDRVVERVKRSAENGEPWEDTFPLRGKDGEYRWFLTRAVPIRNEAGAILRWFGTNTDVTERIRMEEALREGDRRKDEFLAILAHELRNPLAPIRNSLDILRITVREDPATQRISEVMERQVNHMIRLVEDLMEVSRISRGKIELRKELIDVASIIRSALDSSRPLIDAAGHDLVVQVLAEPLILEGDPVRLAQVFANLLNNAAKYTEPGGQIRLAVRREADRVAISVRDTGTGIPPDSLPHVFELFMQVDHRTNRAQGGLGIGLALVKSLVEMHGGSVEARSEGTGRGCEFIVCLPLSAARVPTDQPGKDDGRTADTARRRVLVVDDNHDAANSLGMLLELIGADVHIV
jgi:PAS domain S-box-containing protein